MISRVVSTDIVKYLQKKKELSVDEIAVFMGTTPDHIKDVIKNKQQFTAKDLNTYLKSSNLHFWEFAIEAIPLDHLTKKARKRVLLCKEISFHIKKKNGENGKK